VPLLEDAAHGPGARIGSRHLGTLGLAGAFSFFPNKNLAIGEGGLVVTDDDALAERIRLLRSHGVTATTWDRRRGADASYDVVAHGFNYRIDEPRSELALRRLRRLDAENAGRGRIVERYREALADVEGLALTPPAPPRAALAHHLFTIVLDEAVDRDAFRRALAEGGVQTSVHYPPVHRFSIFAGSQEALPVTEGYSARTVTLPLFPHMTTAQQGTVIEAVRQALG
jgi:dTDP-4-amino-4,6-dideoxygalactose transaminase